jgi:hypothetical protein
MMTRRGASSPLRQVEPFSEGCEEIYRRVASDVAAWV